MVRYINHNENPEKNRVGDCTVRAIAKVLGIDWHTAYWKLCVYGAINCDMPSSNAVWGKFLRSQGFRRYVVDDRDQEFYTVNDFCVDHPKGAYVLALSSHVVAVIDGRFFDTFDSSNEIPIYYWERTEETKEGE